MPVFTCRIGTSDGRIIEIEFESANRALLQQHLREQGLHALSVRRRLFRPLFSTSHSSGLNSRDFLSFNQELLVLIRSGLPILQVLDTVLERSESGPMRQVLREIREDVRGGAALSETFGKFPRIFPHLYVASIKAGERTGELPLTIGRYIAYQKRVEAIKAKVRSATFYPMILCLASISVVLFLLFYVIPSFTQIYADARVELPFLTRVLIATADAMIGKIYFWAPSLLFAAVTVSFFARTPRGRCLIDRALLAVPFFGHLAIEYAVTGFCRTLSTILAGGIPLTQAMRMARGTLNNQILEGKVDQAVRKVEEGTSFSAALTQSGFFPVIALRMIAAGETTGSLGEMLTEVSEFYEGEVERRLDRMTTLVEPLMMLAMGLLVGGIVVAMYIPIFQLAGTVR
jgi:type IV pilus assembly protein PilC